MNTAAKALVLAIFLVTAVLQTSAVLIVPPVGAEEPPKFRADLSVADSKRVPPEEYREASDRAALGSDPLDVALEVVGKFEGSTQSIFQVYDRSESPQASRITVLRDGLMDDAVRGERWDIALEKTAKNVWRIKEVHRSWRCWRGEQTNRFASKLCP